MGQSSLYPSNRIMLLGWLITSLGTGTPLLRAQERVTPAREAINGRIINAESGDPVVRAVVYLEGSLIQSTTNEDGIFSLPVSTGSPKLLIQALGYREKSVLLPGTDVRPDIRLDPAWPADWLRASGLQQDDPDYEPRVDRPAFARGQGPTVLVDEGHHNAHTANGRYQAFTSILELDGYVVEPSASAFTLANLKRADVLVVATPIDGLDDGSRSNRSPFKAAEVTALHEWVEGGGALLVISDHMPIPAALDPLLRAFGVEGDNGYTVTYQDGQIVPSPMVFRRGDRSLRSHPIVAGRSSAERIDSVATFSGFAFRAPPSFQPLLVIRDSTYSVHVANWFEPSLDNPRVYVGGWFQGGTARVGRGRLVVNGEAAMFTAQVRGEDRWKNGLTSPEAGQNLQYLLNIMHWLSGLLD